MHMGQFVEVDGDIRLESVNIQPAMMSSMAFPQMNVHTAPNSNFMGGPGANFGVQSAFSASPVPSIQSCRITTGSRIFVRGFIPPTAKRFELNLLQGHSDGSDIAFHFNPRFDARTIVKNNRHNGQWGNEENQPLSPSAFLNPGAPLDLQIVCDPYKYTVRTSLRTKPSTVTKTSR